MNVVVDKKRDKKKKKKNKRNKAIDSGAVETEDLLTNDHMSSENSN